MLPTNSQPVADLSPRWKGSKYGQKSRICDSLSMNEKDLVTATDMIEENMERGERQFAAKALPRGPSQVESPGGKKKRCWKPTEMFAVYLSL